MQITDSNQRRQLCDWADRVSELIRSDDSVTAANIDQAIGQFRDGRFLLTVLGKLKRGKSTLVNALLGRSDDLLAPVDKFPASNVISRFVWSEEPYARVFYRSSTVPEAIPYERIRDFVTEEFNPNNVKRVETVEIGGPFPEFDRDLILVDTPGAGSIHEYHDALLHAFIPQSDAVIFLVAAGMPIDQDELELLRKIKAADVRKVVFALNKVDAIPAADVEEAVAHNRACLAQAGINVDQIHRISAKRARTGDVAGSGIEGLLGEIRELLTTQKGRLLESRLIARVVESAEPILQAWELELSASNYDPAELARHREKLLEAKQQLSAGEQDLPRRFAVRWNRTLDAFQANLAAVRESVKSQLVAVVQQSSLLGVGRLARDLPSLLVQTSEDALQPYALELEKELQTACTELNTGYRELTAALHTPVVAGSGNGTLMTGALAGTATAAAGAGLVAAAQAAAAASVTYVTTPSMLGVVATYFTGTAGPLLTTTAVPVAAPVWVALAAPIGWTIVGIGAVAIPFAWAISKSKQKSQLEAEAIKQTDALFQSLLDTRLPLLRSSAESYVEEYRSRARQEIERLEEALRRASENVSDEATRCIRREQAERLRSLLATPGATK
jgi:GTP-binding protein EngB required for normal cell division